MKVLVLDNYDSFTYNLVHLIEKISTTNVSVKRNDKISLEEIKTYDKILLSPGPGLPVNAGIMPQLIQEFAKTKSIFGVCLGMQAIGEGFGAKLENLNNVYHGIATTIKVTESNRLFNNCPESFTVGRYHSWVVSSINLPKELEVIAKDEQGQIMALTHKTYDVSGVQFHPESILSEYGEHIISNWLKA